MHQHGNGAQIPRKQHGVAGRKPTGDARAQAVAVPVVLILAYGVARVLAQAFGEVRDAIFAPVSQRAIRNIALEVFHHLHALSLKFHLERRTGGLSRIVSRGTDDVGRKDAGFFDQARHWRYRLLFWQLYRNFSCHRTNHSNQ